MLRKDPLAAVFVALMVVLLVSAVSVGAILISRYSQSSVIAKGDIQVPGRGKCIDPNTGKSRKGKADQFYYCLPSSYKAPPAAKNSNSGLMCRGKDGNIRSARKGESVNEEGNCFVVKYKDGTQGVGR